MDIELLKKNQGMQSLMIKMEKGEVIPLHDHPNTHVFMMCMQGALKVDFYRFVDESKHQVVLHETCLMNPGMNHLITPQGANLHQVEALEASIFLDVMAPGYLEGAQEPTWYKLKRIDTPVHDVVEIEQPESMKQAKADALARYQG